MGQGKDHMEVFGIEQVCLPGLYPLPGLKRYNFFIKLIDGHIKININFHHD